MENVIDKKQLNQTIAANVTRLRRDKGLSQEKLAESVGVHRVTIARIETGRHTPEAELLFSLADVLQVPTDVLRQISEIP
jgi:transcriptional regulator with XRE-family HTH domain